MFERRKTPEPHQTTPPAPAPPAPRLGSPGLCRNPAAFFVKNKDSAQGKTRTTPEKTVPSIINPQTKFFVCDLYLKINGFACPLLGYAAIQIQIFFQIQIVM